jgi:N-acetylmuramoyl-L-alanine amidase
MRKIVIILGTPHGVNVAGKRSPDGLFREYAYGRMIVEKLKRVLERKGYLVVVDWPNDEVPDDQSKELKLRTDIVNAVCEAYGKDNCLYVSIHNNAAGSDGQWKEARGWCVYTTVGKTKSDVLASCLWDAAKELLPQTHKTAVRADWSDGDPDFESNLWVLRKSACTAVLTENLFQDNRQDMEWLLTDEGVETIVEIHRRGIEGFVKEYM